MLLRKFEMSNTFSCTHTRTSPLCDTYSYLFELRTETEVWTADQLTCDIEGGIFAISDGAEQLKP